MNLKLLVKLLVLLFDLFYELLEKGRLLAMFFDRLFCLLNDLFVFIRIGSLISINILRL